MRSALAALEKEVKDSRYEQDGDPEGVEDGDALIKQKGNEYLTKIWGAIKARWEVPDLISSKERMFLKADVVIYIDASGKLIDIKFKKKSKNSLYDSAVEGTIKRAAPFPPPPPELADTYAEDGIEIPFSASKL